MCSVGGNGERGGKAKGSVEHHLRAPTLHFFSRQRRAVSGLHCDAQLPREDEIN